MSRMWEIREGYQPHISYRHGKHHEMGGEYEEAFEEGYECGYEEAMEKVAEKYGHMDFRGESRRTHGGYGHMGYRDEEDDDMMNERRRRRANGRYM